MSPRRLSCRKKPESPEGYLFGSCLASMNTVQIRLKFEDSGDPGREVVGGSSSSVEVLEGHQEFLNAVLERLHEITRRQRNRLRLLGEETCPVRSPVRSRWRL